MGGLVSLSMTNLKFYREAATLSYENAVSLSKEARLLFDNGYFARTVGLSISSMEEQAKAFALLTVAVGKVSPDALEWEERKGRVKRFLKEHEQKQQMYGAIFFSKFAIENYLPDLVAGKMPKGVDATFRSLHGIKEEGKVFAKMEKSRQHAIYVGVGKDYPIIVPLANYDREDAETYLDWASQMLPLLGEVFKKPDYWFPILAELEFNEGQKKTTLRGKGK